MAVTLVTGGTRSGKSRHAESLLKDDADVTYVATGSPADGADVEWTRRVSAHQSRRSSSWRVLETTDAAGVVRGAEGSVLVDCLGTWLTGLVDDADLWTDLPAASRLVRAAADDLRDTLATTRARVVVVTNEVGLAPVATTPAGRWFQDELGQLNAEVSARADHVHLVVAGRVLDLSAAPVVR